MEPLSDRQTADTDSSWSAIGSAIWLFCHLLSLRQKGTLVIPMFGGKAQDGRRACFFFEF